MSLRGPVLVAFDFSELADEALRQGHEIAAAMATPLVVGHVLPEAFRIRVLFPHLAGFDAAQQSELEAKARAGAAHRVAAVLGKDNLSSVEVDSGSAHAGLLAIADRVDAGLIVTGPGSTALHLARAAKVPVLVARSSPAGGPVLGATDFSDPSLPAIRLAAGEAARRGVTLKAIHCVDVDPNWNLAPVAAPGMIAAAPLPQDVIDQFTVDAREKLVAAIAATGRAGEPVVAFRSPGHGIVDTATEAGASLVVVGTRGRTGLLRLALGSVAEYVMGHAKCSVLTVPLNLP